MNANFANKMHNRARRTISVAGHDRLIQVTDDGSRTLIHPDTGVAYHSASGAVAETEHVYLTNSGVAERFERWQSGDQPVAILEIGLGTGLAMLMTLAAANRCDCHLRYTAVECDLPDRELLHQLQLERHVGDVGLVDSYLDWYRSLGNSIPIGPLAWNPGVGRQVSIGHMDAVTWGNQVGDSDLFDAIYFDPFAPDTNPELWQPTFLKRMFELLKPTCRLVTYCVSRQVREAMESVGFQVQRVPGPNGGKREVMIATK